MLSIKQQLADVLRAERAVHVEKIAAIDHTLYELSQRGSGPLPHHLLMAARRRGITKPAPASSTAVRNVVDNLL